MGVLGVCPGRAGGFRDGAGKKKGDKHRESLGLPFEYRVEGTMWDCLTLFETICILMLKKERECKGAIIGINKNKCLGFLVL